MIGKLSEYVDVARANLKQHPNNDIITPEEFQNIYDKMTEVSNCGLRTHLGVINPSYESHE